jgi:hypothetical protein
MSIAVAVAVCLFLERWLPPAPSDEEGDERQRPRP